MHVSVITACVLTDAVPLVPHSATQALGAKIGAQASVLALATSLVLSPGALADEPRIVRQVGRGFTAVHYRELDMQLRVCHPD